MVASAKAYSAAVLKLFREDPAYPLNIPNGSKLCPRCDCRPAHIMWHPRAEALALLAACACTCHEALRFGYKGLKATPITAGDLL